MICPICGDTGRLSNDTPCTRGCAPSEARPADELERLQRRVDELAVDLIERLEDHPAPKARG